MWWMLCKMMMFAVRDILHHAVVISYHLLKVSGIYSALHMCLYLMSKMLLWLRCFYCNTQINIVLEEGVLHVESDSMIDIQLAKDFSEHSIIFLSWSKWKVQFTSQRFRNVMHCLASCKFISEKFLSLFIALNSDENCLTSFTDCSNDEC